MEYPIRLPLLSSISIHQVFELGVVPGPSIRWSDVAPFAANSIKHMPYFGPFSSVFLDFRSAKADFLCLIYAQLNLYMHES